MTRTIAIAPSLIFTIIGGPSGAGRLIIIASVCIFYHFSFFLSFRHNLHHIIIIIIIIIIVC